MENTCRFYGGKIFTSRIKNNCRPGGGYLPDNNDGCNANDSGNAFDGGCDGGC
ncbi:MAG: hypothetical protein K6G73_03805 [Marinilabiliaceae bacterium]|nr:hypothetical protein [Marinilabiliaceae bacterium]